MKKLNWSYCTTLASMKPAKVNDEPDCGVVGHKDEEAYDSQNLIRQAVE